MYPLFRSINAYLVRWARKKYKRLRALRNVQSWWLAVVKRDRKLFAHWAWMPHFWLAG
ncbi:hypothetical protein Ga0074812_15414 [Parafrankia irregularis]|uniref:RNA-directed DNA polymerase n=1 Tax=Parafrankia irregularis TaxID=795642 RepID=A0A0S4R0X6_9ACTN|nr:hypothetical protein Ga0074812_15414 [Parafrankia irregularis]